MSEQSKAPKERSATYGMTIKQRILHVGGRDNAAGYVEFGSVQAVAALVAQVVRDLPDGAPGFWLAGQCGQEVAQHRAQELAAVQQGVQGARITIDFKQATELLEMFGGEPTEYTLTHGQGHGGCGLYAHSSEYPEDGAIYLGESDAEAVPATHPTLQGLEQAKQAVRDYYFALDTRQHGGVAADKALRQVQQALGMQWQQGQEAAARAAQAKQGERDA